MVDLKFFKNLRERLFRGFVIYLGSTVINKAIPFLLLPILTKYLSTEEYGILAIYQVMISFGDTLVGMRMNNNVSRHFFQRSKEFLARLMFNLLLVLWFTLTIFLIFVAVYLGLEGEQFSIPDRWLYALPIIAVLNMINSINLTILKNSRKALEYGTFEISRTIFDLSITIILIVVYSYGWEGRVNGILFGALIIAVISLFRMWNTGFLKFEIDFSQIKGIWLVCLHLIHHGLGSKIITLSDRIFIDRMVSASAVGIYTVGYQFGMIMTLIVAAFMRTWSPWIYEMLAEESREKKNTIVRATYLVAIGFFVLALLITGVSYYLLPFMTAESYHGGYEYVIWIAIGYAFNGLYSLVHPYGIHVGHTSHLGITSLIAAVINLIANYYLISLNDAMGAAQATLISYIFMFLMVWWYSAKLYPMPWFTFYK